MHRIASLRGVTPFLRLHCLLLIAAIGAGGCSPWSTFPPAGDTRGIIEYPELPPIPGLIARALGRVHDLDGQTGPILFNLPASSPPQLFGKVRWELDGARVLTDPAQEDADRAVHLAHVRLRGTECEVDVISRGADGVPRVTTVYFRRGVFESWQLERTRVWRIRAEIPPVGWSGAPEDANAPLPPRRGELP